MPGAERLDPKELTNLQELVMSMVWSEEALVTLLEEKGILSREEVIEEIEQLREEQPRRKS